MSRRTAAGMLRQETRKTESLRQALKKDIRFLVGKKIFLEPLGLKHFSSTYVSWLNDSVVCRENRHAVFPATPAELRRWLETAPRHRDALHFAIRLIRDGRHVGNVGLINLVWVDRSVEIAILIGDKAVWGKGVGGEVCSMLLEYCFDRLNMHRVWMGISSRNEAMIRIAKKLGMRQEGRFRDYMYKEGKYLDILQFAVLAGERRTR